ncbi:MAG TPA: DNA translocase FtsK 4TM domain-containing protein [Bryobacteraceae bacterium]|nr:DNA translocase FtsK 4TM domain-containing protein [Bryobacteraceae bacterium]
MQLLRPSADRRLNLLTGLLFLIGSVVLAASLFSHSPDDPAWNTAAEALRPRNWIGYPGALFSDIALSLAGFASWLIPVMVCLFGLRRMRSQTVEAPGLRLFGAGLLVLSVCTLLSLAPDWKPLHETMPPGGVVGLALSAYLLANLNFGGTLALVAVAVLISLYLTTSFTVETVEGWIAGPMAWIDRRVEAYENWQDQRQARAEEMRAEKESRRASLPDPEPPQDRRSRRPRREERPEPEFAQEETPPWNENFQAAPAPAATAPAPAPSPAYMEAEPSPAAPANYIPIVPLEQLEAAQAAATPAPAAAPASAPPWDTPRKKTRKNDTFFQLPSTKLLSEPPARSPYDEQELHETAARIKVKFEEFNVFGSVVQINPGPVVTTFEFKPEAGIKVSRITQLSEDLCLGLQAESVLIERIPGKSTVGIEVPNRRREVISLRQILESDEFRDSTSKLTIPLGKDISGRMKVATLESMPHVLIAGSTGSGKSVMLNTLITSVLYKATPEDVRMIMVDPKRVELGVYEGIPHLLTPVITDPKKATYALRNAVLEMERRLKLLAAQGVRNIDQYNRKVREILGKPRDLFAEDGENPELDELRPLPYILIIIDELADLMMLERAGVEESITRLAQMARAVGMHLVLATQRPSVDVITGLIKANFPTRISFRVATRVDSRTILDDMGAQHLLGKGDMLYRPPGTSRLTRVHGAYVSEDETCAVVENWKAQAQPDYDQSFLMAPPNEEGDDEDADGDAALTGEEDPRYQDAVRAVCELGKASTSVLQRRLRLGYGRAARILDMMYRDGIIGPPDGSRPREVLKRPDWLNEIGDRDD